MDNRVYIVRCPDYTQVEKKIDELMQLMGGIEKFAAKDENIILKPNLLLSAEPDRAVTTHPEVVRAVGRLANTTGARLLIADSPGSGYAYNERQLRKVYRRCGMIATGFDVNYDTTFDTISLSEGRLIKRFEVITPVIRSDGVFNLCKLKTHLFTAMTGAVKNLFGVIPGLTKPGYHARLHNSVLFAGMLLDLMTLVAPRISIMDAVMGMEGNGPNAGDPRFIGLLLGSTNPLALDIVASEIIGMQRLHNPLLIEAENRNLSPRRIEQTEIIGEKLIDCRIRDFKIPGSIQSDMAFGSMNWLTPLVRNVMTVQPVVDREKCIACGVCRDACPMEVISVMDKEYAQIDNKKCIRCYCCHEMCPNDAIALKSTLIYRFLKRVIPDGR